MHDMSQLKQLLEKELGILAMQNELSMPILEKLHKLTDTIKNIDKIEMLEEESEYSQRGYYDNGRSYDDMSYGRGNSYARRRRDSMGRYTRDYSGRRYSRADGESEMVFQLEELMHEAESEKDRMAIQKALNALRS